MPAAKGKSKSKAEPTPRLSVVNRLYRIRPSATIKPPVKKKKAAQPKPRQFKPVPTARKLLRDSLNFIWTHRLPLFFISAIYAVTYILLVTGFNGKLNVSNTHQNIEQLLGHHPLTNSLLTSVVVLFGSSSADTQSSSTGQFFQVLLPVLASIVVLWTIRRLMIGQAFRIRDAFYRSMQPLVPFILVLGSLVVRLLPMLLGSYVYVIIKTNGYASTVWQTLFFTVIWLALVIGSLLWSVPATLALPAVTLPDVDPGLALKATRSMVRGQRWKILLRLLTGFTAGAAVALVVVFMCVYWLPAMVVPLSLCIGFVSLSLVNVYVYQVYRSLL